MNSATIRGLEQRRAAGEALAEEQELELSEERIGDALYAMLQAALAQNQGGTLRFSIDTLERRGGKFVAALSLVGAVADWDPDFNSNSAPNCGAHFGAKSTLNAGPSASHPFIQPNP
jgi:hypothetical protein